MRVREYGRAGPWVVLLHGGPGAPGGMAPLARGLADGFRVLEPWQRSSGGEPLSVARHVADLRALVARRCGGERPALVGSSWGAMLALAFAAEHPGSARALVLIGCGTFDPLARARLRATLAQRIDAALQRRLEAPHDDADAHLLAMGELLAPVYSHDLVEGGTQVEACDARAHRETWDDMLRLQAEGRYPAAFAAIEEPVLMLHGAVDPHPGDLIRASLAPYVARLEYRQWERCGHYPWLERAVRDEFFAVLRAWLAAHLA